MDAIWGANATLWALTATADCIINTGEIPAIEKLIDALQKALKEIKPLTKSEWFELMWEEYEAKQFHFNDPDRDKRLDKIYKPLSE